MSKKILVLTTVLALVVLGGFGCGKKAAEKTAEKAIKESSGGDVDVDIDDESVEIKDTNSNSSMTIGKNELPSNWPSDAPTYEGDITATYSTGDTYISATWQTDKSADNVYDYYQAELPDQGWNIESTLSAGSLKQLVAKKDNRMLTVSATPLEDQNQTSYTVIVATQEDTNSEDTDSEE